MKTLPKDVGLQVKSLLESYWPLSTVDEGYFGRVHDDNDGDHAQKLSVTRGPDGDMYVWIEDSRWLRFRTHGGGGRSMRTHNALRILAEAMRLDALEDPNH